MKLYLGIDPGLGGALAAISAAGHVLDTTKMPADPGTLINYLLKLRRRCAGEMRVVLEAVHSLPEQGHVGAFTFGKGVGRIEASLAAARIIYDEVYPLRWQRLLDCRTGGNKNISKARAIELFPDWPITHVNADALLLAEYRRRLGESILFHDAHPTPAYRLRSFLHTRG